jgi:hypothetical protein
MIAMRLQVTAEPVTCCDERGYMRQHTITATSTSTSDAEAWVLSVASQEISAVWFEQFNYVTADPLSEVRAHEDAR